MVCYHIITKRKGDFKMKIMFWINADEEVIEMPDDATEEEIREEFNLWFDGCVSASWDKVDD